jgi:hypothetical protein
LLATKGLSRKAQPSLHRLALFQGDGQITEKLSHVVRFEPTGSSEQMKKPWAEAEEG